VADGAPCILAFAGSLRAGSYNKHLIQNVAVGARAAGADVRVLDLKDYPVPVYDADLYDAAHADPHALHDRGGRIGPAHDRPMPEGLLRFKEHVRWSQGWLVATPEYSRSYPGMFKNLIDWLTRLAPGESPLDNFTYKVAGIVSAAYEGGGVTAVSDTRRLLGGLGCVVVPGTEVFTISDDLFDREGRIVDETNRRRAEAVGERVVRMVRRLHTGRD
jgi:NAD(P)H-dependent FMN reductase